MADPVTAADANVDAPEVNVVTVVTPALTKPNVVCSVTFRVDDRAVAPPTVRSPVTSAVVLNCAAAFAVNTPSTVEVPATVRFVPTAAALVTSSVETVEIPAVTVSSAV